MESNTLRHQSSTQALLCCRNLSYLEAMPPAAQINSFSFSLIDFSCADRKRPHHVVVLVLEDVTMVDVGLRCRHAIRQFVSCAYGREIAGVDLDRILEPALRRIRRLHRPRGVRRWIDSTRDTVWATICRLIGLGVE